MSTRTEARSARSASRDEAQGRSALHSGQGPLRRRHLAAGHAVSGAGAQHVSARRDQEHRHQRGDEGARRQGRDHRQGSRRRGARVAADLPRLRQADGARDRQGACSSIRKLPPCSPRRAARRPMAPRRWRSSTSRCRLSPIRLRRKTDKVILRPDREQKTNHIYHWEVGDKDGTARGACGQPEANQASGSGSSAAIPLRSNRAAVSRCSTQWVGYSST